MRSGPALREQRRAGRLHRNDFDTRIPCFQILGHAGDRAARSDAGDKDVHLAVRILPDLGAGGLPVRLGIGGVDKLTGNDAVRRLRGQLFRLFDRTGHALGALRQHQLGAVGLHQHPPLDRHGLRHDDDDPIALCRGDGGKADARVAAGRLDDGRAGLELPARLRVGDHRFGDAVLGAAAGIKGFQLSQHSGPQRVCLLNVCQLQQRSFADQFFGGLIDSAHVLRFLSP